MSILCYLPPRNLSPLALAIAASFSSAAPAFAQEVPAVPAGACFQAPAALSADQVTSFLSKPGELLANNPEGGIDLSLAARGLTGSDASAVPEIIDLADAATSAQILALGLGLAQATSACAATRPDVSQYVQLAVANSGNPELISAFLSSSNNVETGALTGATSVTTAAAPAAAAPITAGPGDQGTGVAGNLVANPPFTFGGLRGGGGFRFTTTVAAGSVSPTV